MSKVTVREVVKKLDLENQKFEKYHNMTLGLASISKFHPNSKLLKKWNNGQSILPVAVTVASVILILFTSGLVAPFILLGMNYLTGKKMTKLLKVYCTESNINVEVDDTRGNLLYVRNKMIDIAKLESDETIIEKDVKEVKEETETKEEKVFVKKDKKNMKNMKKFLLPAVGIFLFLIWLGNDSSIDIAKNTKVVPGSEITIEEFVGKLEDRINEISGENAVTVWSMVDKDDKNDKDMVKVVIYQTKSKKSRESTIVLTMNENQEIEYLSSFGTLGETQYYPEYIHNVASQIFGDQDLARQAYMLMVN